MSRKTEKKRRMSAGRILDTGMTYLILLAVAFVFFFPCLWLILASFSKSGTIYSFDGFFPTGYSLASEPSASSCRQNCSHVCRVLSSRMTGSLREPVYGRFRPGRL